MWNSSSQIPKVQSKLLLWFLMANFALHSARSLKPSMPSFSRRLRLDALYAPKLLARLKQRLMNLRYCDLWAELVLVPCGTHSFRSCDVLDLGSALCLSLGKGAAVFAGDLVACFKHWVWHGRALGWLSGVWGRRGLLSHCWHLGALQLVFDSVALCGQPRFRTCARNPAQQAVPSVCRCPRNYMRACSGVCLTAACAALGFFVGRYHFFMVAGFSAPVARAWHVLAPRWVSCTLLKVLDRRGWRLGLSSLHVCRSLASFKWSGSIDAELLRVRTCFRACMS